MAEQQLTSRASESSNINLLNITSNKNASKQVDISNGTTDLYYYESILQETIRVQVMYVDSGNSVEVGGNYKSVIEGLPLVGQESVQLTISDNFDNKLSLTLYVNKVAPFGEDSKKSVISLDLVSEEYFINEQARLNVRFDGKISDHIKRILTDKRFLGTEKTLDIEPTSNNYNFIGNNKKPFYICTWLSKKSIPSVSNATGNTAGYFFFETSKGFRFKSIDKLLEAKPVKKLIYNETTDGRGTEVPSGYDGKVAELTTDNTIDVKTKLESGAYSTRIILFDPFNCYYEIVEPRAKETEKNLKLAGNELPVFNKKFGGESIGSDFTRSTYMLIDKGSLPSGDTKTQIEEKSKEPNFDPKNILNQSTMRYNQLFTIKKTITIPGDFSLHAGETIHLDAPAVGDGQSKDSSREFGGIYMIADLCHYITPFQTFTKLNLVRDSYGRKPISNIPV